MINFLLFLLAVLRSAWSIVKIVWALINGLKTYGSVAIAILIAIYNALHGGFTAGHAEVIAISAAIASLRHGISKIGK